MLWVKRVVRVRFTRLVSCLIPAAPTGGGFLPFRPLIALIAGQGVGQIQLPWTLDMFIGVPGHHVLVEEQPPEQVKLRVTALL